MTMRKHKVPQNQRKIAELRVERNKQARITIEAFGALLGIGGEFELMLRRQAKQMAQWARAAGPKEVPPFGQARIERAAARRVRQNRERASCWAHSLRNNTALTWNMNNYTVRVANKLHVDRLEIANHKLEGEIHARKD